MSTVEEAGLRTVWVQHRRDKRWRVCAEGMQLSIGQVSSSRATDSDGITRGIFLQSERRKNLILILGGTNLQMRSSEVLVLTGA